MAENHGAAGHPAMDYAEHERTYEMFTKMTKWGTIGMVALMAIMALTLI
ncbi:MAG: Bacterial aa3 type cytochrome c oxidase subunit [Hyphomicrobiales bacterium]|jgi:hypothetical protein|nr:Bacterial aa3 type cytochrome c oxidase subunit [Hyphomicrobiales bacterium]